MSIGVVDSHLNPANGTDHVTDTIGFDIKGTV